MKDRELEQANKHPQKIDKAKIPTKLSYLDILIKQRGSFPGPSTYNFDLTWAKPNPAANLSKKNSPSKNTFIDQIFKRAQQEKLPAVGEYNIIKTEEQVKAQIKAMQQKPRAKSVDKQCFLGECQHLANSIPGVGNYNPRTFLPAVHLNRTNPKEMIKKHKEIYEKEKKRVKESGPDVGTYTPLDISIDTFDYEKKKYASKERSKAKSKFWGQEERFKNLKNSKSKVENVLPGPGKYNLLFQWAGKKQKNQDIKKNWYDNVSKGIQKSLYY